MTDQAPAATGQPDAQGQAKPWYDVDGATDELKGYVQNKGWDNPVKALTAYQNLEKYHGVPAEQIIKLPKDGEPMDAVYNRLGRPESADKYEIKLEGVQLDEARLGGFKEIAHKIGLNQSQVKALAEFDAGYLSKTMEGFQTQRMEQQKAEETELRREWGPVFEERSELGRRAVRAFAPEGQDKAEFLDKIEGAIGTKAMLKMFAKIGEGLGEAKIIDSGGGDRPFGYTVEQAKADRQTLMSELKGDKTRLDNYNKGVGTDVEKMNRLNKIIAG